ncbi:D-xylulose 5-phosphate/D-fructose 6-phosphate phosphoketolase [Trichocladium antarcticum]|uniref:D-xylulose 5-phosphate/D-fructose 6-phosphate phosphoketolase n=1 Tax=Trichocladium antarcticum TaxID=1450529 RepID=A0AAN6UN84_9PEZI|nr:D-xylulose 5-phosphate/D-fructose 6-phosphate phosphoketolase [Trichocladium antarcticum]
MPGQKIPQSNPPPLPSHLPDHILDLGVHIQKKPLPDHVRASLSGFQRAACYIAAAMIFLRDNVLLESELQHDHIKSRLLGHWGTCPGLILVQSHLDLLIRNHDVDMIYVIGPGHGAPAALAALWLEGSLERFYPGEYDRNAEGLRNLITRFSVAGGFPSHINAETPGAIHEGGELGYALAVSFGAVMDNPDLVVTCIVGDGEAETGPTATAWHAIKYLDPRESGAVIPILHVNGFKISERTIFGCMDDKEIVCLFSGYGYQVCIVDDLDNINDDLQNALEWALAEVKKIQHAARSGNPIIKPRWPMLVLRTPKGWTGPRELDGKIIEGSFHSHQVPLPKANSDDTQLEALKEWLSSYNVSQLLRDGRPTDAVLEILPEKDEKKLGQVRATYDPYIGLKAVDWKEYAVEKGADQSCMQVVGRFLDKVSRENPATMRLFSPDELESNKLDAILQHTQRNFQWDEYSRANGGRVIETLSEHDCQGFLQGYTLTGRTAIFPSYESFLGIVHTMMVQYSKFVKIAREVRWRGDLPSINYIETSTWTRQEHNGFSHQNPSFIGAVLNLKAEAARVYLPPDANTLLSTLHHCLASRNHTNLIIGSKQPTPVYLTASEAAAHCAAGASIFHFASAADDATPDVVLVGIGVELTFEVVAAAALLRQLAPALHVRVVNVTDLLILPPESRHPHALSDAAFAALFTADRPALFNYHGYATELQGLLFGRPGTARMRVNGYCEEGSTTTPFDMMLVNGVSRFDVAERALRAVAATATECGKGLDLEGLVREIRARVEGVRRCIEDKGRDPDDIYDMPQFD